MGGCRLRRARTRSRLAPALSRTSIAPTCRSSTTCTCASPKAWSPWPREDFALAAQHFHFVQSLEGEIDDAELLAISNFWTARCLRRMGRYDDALGFAVRGRRLALDSGYAPMAAIMQVLESWLAFQKGKLNEAAHLLQAGRGRRSSAPTISSAAAISNPPTAGSPGARRATKPRSNTSTAPSPNTSAATHTTCTSLAPSSISRSWNACIALRQQQEIDRASARRRADSSETAGEPSRTARAEIERLRADARTQLASALAIYTAHGQHRGIGSVHINSGLLHLDGGDLESAAADAATAFAQGEDAAGLHPAGARTPAPVHHRERPASRSRSAKIRHTTPVSPPASPAMPSSMPGKPRTRDCWRAPTSGRG